MGQRMHPHIISDKSLTKIKGWSENNDFFYRELSGMDYGVDTIIELFENGENVTAKIAFLQIKGAKNVVQKLKKSDEISISISRATAYYSL